MVWARVFVPVISIDNVSERVRSLVIDRVADAVRLLVRLSAVRDSSDDSVLVTVNEAD